MSILLAERICFNKKQNWIFIRGSKKGIKPRNLIKIEIEGEDFFDKIKNLINKVKNGEIEMSNFSYNLNKFQFAFDQAEEPKKFWELYKQKEIKKFLVINNKGKVAVKSGNFNPRYFSNPDFKLIPKSKASPISQFEAWVWNKFLGQNFNTIKI